MNDMRQLLERVKGDPPPVRLSVDDIVRSGRRRAQRRTYARGAGVVCGLSAVVLAAATLLPVGDSGEAGPSGDAGRTETTAPAPAPSFSFTFKGYTVGAYRVADPFEVTPGYERAEVVQPNVDLGGGLRETLRVGLLTVYRPGAFRPDRFQSGTPVTVNGRAGFAATVQTDMIVGGPASSTESKLHPTVRPVDVPGLAWQYADGAWATIESVYSDARTMPATVQRQLAERFTTRAPVPVKVPLRVTHLPDGWKLGSAGVHGAAPGDDSVALVRYVPATTDFSALTGPLDLDGERVPLIRIPIAPVERQGPYAHPVDPPCPAGQHFCDVKIDSWYYAEVHDQSGTLPAAQVKAIADGLQFATVADKSTWYPVS